jgi:hypothetical protein
MIYLYNIIGLILATLWNGTVLVGTLWLILEKDWSPWTLVATLLFFIRWKEWDIDKPKDEPKEEVKIII